MLRNYLVVALRALQRHPFHALLNVAGLAIGIATCLLILLYVQDELSYDQMYHASDQTFRVVETRTGLDGIDQDFVYTMGPLAAEMERAIPDVDRTVRAISSWASGRQVVQRGVVRFYVGDQLFTEPGFFDVFDLEFTSGRPEGALDEPMEVVLSEVRAAQYFGEADPVGETISVEGIGDFTVTGVVKMPTNTHLDYSVFFSLATLLNYDGWRTWLNDDWSSNAVITYVQLRTNAGADVVQDRLREIVATHANDEVRSTRQAYLQPVTDIHLGSSHIDFDEHAAAGRPMYLYLFSAVALIVVLIASINYMNMATARSMRRALEIGMRKVVGARRGQLVMQFLAESLLMTLAALAGSLVLARAALPVFNHLADKNLTLALSGPIVLGAILLAVSVGLLAGAYPAFFLSRFRPSAVLRGRGSRAGGASPVRKGLVVAQFTMSIVLMIATLVVHDQLRFVQSTDLGFRSDQLVVVDINSGTVRNQFDTVRQRFAAVPGVEDVSVSNNVPGDWKIIPHVDVRPVGAEDVLSAAFFGVDEHFLDTYGINLIEGRMFGVEVGADSTSILLNATAANLLGVGLGDRIQIPEDEFAATVVGIVDDFHFQSLHRPIGPALLGFHSNPVDVIDYFTIRLAAGSPASTIETLRGVGEQFDPDHPFEMNVLDQRLADFYASEARVRRIFGAAAFLALLVACMGLFGLAAYTAEQRTKEVGIRKVLGATAANITGLLTGEFVRLVGVAFLIAAPLSYVAMRWWLQDFAYKTTIGADSLLIAGLGALAIAIATVSYQAIRAAVSDPVRSLRYE